MYKYHTINDGLRINRWRQLMQRVLLSAFLILCSTTLHAQLYPVQVTVQAMSPYPVYLSDFTQGSSDRVRVQLLLTDVHASRRVRLKLSLQSNSLSLANPDIVSGALPIELSGGLPVYLGNDDLRPYFSPGNLPGLSAAAYAQPLPEGVYTLCIEAFDYITNQPLSRKSCYTMALIQNDPPQLSLPRNNEAVQQQTPQSLLFQWTPRHINAINVSYEFSLLELLDTFISPQAAMQVMQPYYQTTTYATSLWLSPGDAPLTPGRKYAWRVRAKSLSGIDELGVFKNNGYSETWSFRYTDGQCGAPLGLLVTGSSRRSLQLQWQPLPPPMDGAEVSYRVSYRAVNGSQWYDRQTTTTALTLTDLDPGTNYELRIGRLCSGTGYVYSNSITSATAAATDTNTTVRCGIAPAAVDLGNVTPLAAMQTGETFIAGDFTVTTTSVSGSSGTFSGEGYIKIPYLGYAKVRVKFSDIFINQERKMAKGYVETLYDPSWKGILDADKITEGGIGTGQVKTGLAATEYHTDFPIDDPNAIKVRVTGPDNASGISITDVHNGGGSGLQIPGAQLPTTISDSKGDIYTVEQGGGSPVVTKTGWQVPLDQAATELDALAADKGVVQFSAGSNTRYAFDAYRGIYGSSVVWSKSYQSLGSQYRVAAKATLPGKPDHITAEVNLSDPAMKADSVCFVTGKGLRYAATRISGTNYDITLTGSAAGDAQELYALYPTGTAGKYLGLGKLLVAGYAAATAKVVVVPVNGATTDTADIRRQLIASYGGIGISWSLQQAEPWGNSSWDADHNGKLSVTGSGGWSVYTDEMKALNEAYRADHQIIADAAYLFVLPQAAEEGVAGDMPRGKRYGYLFNGSDGRTAAHELGHGLFALKHTFDKAYGFSTTDLADNVMSYGTGTSLSKLQWDAVHAPGLVIGAFEDDKDAMGIAVSNLSTIPDDYKNSDGSISFYTPGGKVITLPKGTRKVEFSLSDPMVYHGTDKTAYYTTIGAIYRFTDDKGNSYDPRGWAENFHYTNPANNEVYYDTLTREFFNTSVKGTPLIGIPFYADPDIKINLVKVSSVAAADYEGCDAKGYTGSGTRGDVNVLLQKVYIPSLNPYKPLSVFPSGHIINDDISGIAITDKNLFNAFLHANTELLQQNSVYAPLLIAHAFQLGNTPIYTNCFADQQQQDMLKVQTQLQNVTIAESNLSVLKYNYEILLKELTKNIGTYDDFKTAANRINNRLMTLSDAQAMKKYFRDSVRMIPCLLDEIEWEQRIYAINKLLSNTNMLGASSVSSEIEDIINKLLESTTRNGQSKLLYDSLKKDDYALFSKLWSGFQAGNFDELIQRLSAVALQYEAYDASAPCMARAMPALDAQGHTVDNLVNSNCFYFKDEADDILSKPGLKYYYDIYSNNNFKLWSRYELANSASVYQLTDNVTPFTVLRYEFPKGNCLAFNGITGQTGGSFYAPAFYGAWSIKRYNQKKAINTVVDGAIILSSVFTGGTVAMIEIAVAGSDLVIQANENALKNTAQGTAVFQGFENVRNAYYTVAGVTAAAQLGKSLLKIDLNALANKTVNETRDLLSSLKGFRSGLVNLGKTAYASMLETRLIYDLSWKEIRPQIKNKLAQATLELKNQIKVYAANVTLNYNVVVADLALQGEQTYLKLNRFDNTVQGTVLHSIDNVGYTVPGSNTLKTGTIELVEDAHGGLIWRVVAGNAKEELITLARKEFDAYGAEWIKKNPFTGKEMFNTESGGYVVAHTQHNNIYPHEFSMSEAFARNSYKVKLLNEKAAAKITTPDAEIIGIGNFDFKNIEANKPDKIRTNVQNYVLNAKRQADNIAFNLADNPIATPEIINQAVENAVETARIGMLKNIADKVGVVYKDGSTKIIEINKFSIENGIKF